MNIKKLFLNDEQEMRNWLLATILFIFSIFIVGLFLLGAKAYKTHYQNNCTTWIKGDVVYHKDQGGSMIPEQTFYCVESK